jgi:hypothetical protein
MQRRNAVKETKHNGLCKDDMQAKRRSNRMGYEHACRERDRDRERDRENVHAKSRRRQRIAQAQSVKRYTRAR